MLQRVKTFGFTDPGAISKATWIAFTPFSYHDPFPHAQAGERLEIWKNNSRNDRSGNLDEPECNYQKFELSGASILNVSTVQASLH